MTNNGKIVCNYLRDDLEKRIDQRVVALNALGLTATRDSLIKDAMKAHDLSPEKQEFSAAVIDMVRGKEDSVPAYVTDDDLLVNIAVQQHLEDLEKN